jgi:hypothetical protein
MTSPARDINQLLSGTLGLIGGTNLFYGQLPEENTARGIPHQCVALYDTGGVFANPRWDRDEINLQIIIRSALDDYDSGYNLAYSIKNSLLGRETVTINGSLYSQFVLEGDINALGFDTSGRARFTLRFRIVRENFTGSSREDF